MNYKILEAHVIFKMTNFKKSQFYGKQMKIHQLELQLVIMFYLRVICI